MPSHHPHLPARRTRRSGAPLVPLDRRAFLLGSAGLVVLAACGSDDGGETSSGTSSGGSDTTVDRTQVNLGQLFDPTPSYARAGVEQRLTIGLFDFEGAPLADEPAELTFQPVMQIPEGEYEPVNEPFGEPLTVPYHTEGIPRGYYAVRFTPDRPGVWSLQTEVQGQAAEAQFQVGPEGGPGVHEVGQPMPSFASATVDDPMDVQPLCTRAEQCPFHDVSFGDALAAAEAPIVLSVSTPAYCQVAICGPVLDLLVDVAPEYPDLTFIHTEPYQAPTPEDPFGAGTVPAMEALGLQFEPSLFLVSADGTLVERLDNIYDLAELRSSLDRLSA